MHKIVMEITLLIVENHGKIMDCVFEFLLEPCSYAPDSVDKKLED